MKEKTIIVCWILLFISILSTSIYCIATALQSHIVASYKTGVTITTPNPEYLIALHYSDNTAEGVLILQLRPKLFLSNKIVRYIYTAPRQMHLWRWILTHGDHVLYGETIDRNVKAGDNIQFVYVVD